MPYIRGSEWRKWDLHVHTPKSIVQSYGGDTTEAWNRFISTIAGLPPEIKVIGITDYLFIDGYEYLLSRKSEIPNIDLIIPNIEFRLNTFSGTQNNTKRHNFHVFFDSSVAVDDIKEQLLSCLSAGYLIEDARKWERTPTRRSLEELGRQIKSTAPSDNSVHAKSDLQVGFDNITYSRDDIIKNLGKDCFKGKYITCVGYSEWNQSKWDQSAAEKRDLINQANFALTSLDDISKINDNTEDLRRNKLNNLVLHASDAHDLGRIGKSYLWIKADPTFAGLKQIINEPNARVFIGDAPPNYKHEHQIIRKISIPQSKGWFADDFEQELNNDLIAVIGGRGSGKSALIEMIAYGAGSKDPSEDAFMTKAEKHKDNIVGTEINLTWADGSTTEFEIGKFEEDPKLVKYLPQNAVEQLCSPRNDSDLIEQIENVIFQALDDTEKMGASNFNELRDRVLEGFEFEKEQLINEINAANKKIAILHNTIESTPDKKGYIATKKDELNKLIKTLPKLTAKDKNEQEELAKLLELRKSFEDKIVVLQKDLEKINTIKTKIKLFQRKLEVFEAEIGNMVEAIGVEDAEAFEFKIDEERIDATLSKKVNDITDKIKLIRSGKKEDIATVFGLDSKDLVAENLNELTKLIDKKNKETKAYETKKLRYQQQKRSIFALEITIKAAKSELNNIEKDIIPRLEKLKEDRLNRYCMYFDILKKEKLTIEKLYKPIQDSLLHGSEADKRLEFEAQSTYEIEEHLKQGLNIIDRTRKGNFREAVSLKEALAVLWKDYIDSELNKDNIKQSVGKLENMFLTYENGERLKIEEQLRENYALEDFYEWLFKLRNFKVISSLKFDNTELHLLSPGQKGIVLLMLFLEIDKMDTRPLLIDQPEENLDNLSVYNDLIDFFRERKLYRQIILITHNANLVVNTDAEQVIVANYNGKRVPRLEYTSGSLEDQAKKIPDVELEKLEDGIIEQVCNILEGGDIAFDKRKKKYLISDKSFRK